SARLLHCRARRAPGANRSSRAVSVRRVARAPGQSTAACGVRHRILHLVRVHRDVHLRFVLVRPPLSLGPMQLGFVYVVFLPSIVTTLGAGRAVHRYGTRPTLWASLALAGAGLPLLVLPDRAAVLLGMVLVGVGTFFAQATATGFVSRAATAPRGP